MYAHMKTTKMFTVWKKVRDLRTLRLISWLGQIKRLRGKLAEIFLSTTYG